MATWDDTTNLALALYNLASPGGEIDAGWMEKGMDRLQIPGYKRQLFARLALAVNKAVTEHRAEMIKAEQKHGRQ